MFIGLRGELFRRLGTLLVPRKRRRRGGHRVFVIRMGPRTFRRGFASHFGAPFPVTGITLLCLGAHTLQSSGFAITTAYLIFETSWQAFIKTMAKRSITPLKSASKRVEFHYIASNSSGISHSQSRNCGFGVSDRVVRTEIEL
jgi:hypothetical protein